MLLPGAKVTAEIAAARGVPEGMDCISPAGHSAFSTPMEMMHFIARLRRLSGGKPTGFKLCIGHPWEWFAIDHDEVGCNAGRGFMLALGCIQAQSCHTGKCPTGVTTQDPQRQQALVVPDKAERVRSFHRSTLHALKELVLQVAPGELLGPLEGQASVFRLYWPQASAHSFRLVKVSDEAAVA